MTWLEAMYVVFFFFFKQKTAYEIRPCDWSSDVCSSDLFQRALARAARAQDRDEIARRDAQAHVAQRRDRRGAAAVLLAHLLERDCDEILHHPTPAGVPARDRAARPGVRGAWPPPRRPPR